MISSGYNLRFSYSPYLIVDLDQDLFRISIKNIDYLLSLAIIEPIIGYYSLLGYIGSNQRRRFRRDIVYVVLILFSISILSSFFSGCFSDRDYLPSFSEKRITGSLGRG